MTTTSTAGLHPLHGHDRSWVTATIRPAGDVDRADVARLRRLIDAVSAHASLVVLDLQATRVRSPRAAVVIDQAADGIERRGGCLLCVNVDDDSRACLAAAGHHAVLSGPGQDPGSFQGSGRGEDPGSFQGSGRGEDPGSFQGSGRGEDPGSVSTSSTAWLKDVPRHGPRLPA